jgi:hypothetical protein
MLKEHQKNINTEGCYSQSEFVVAKYNVICLVGRLEFQ